MYKKTSKRTFFIISGGEEGIRTLDTVARIHDFESRAFSLSATHPVYVYHSKIINVSSTVNARFTGCALSRLIGSSILRMAIALSIKCFLYNLQV